MEQSTRPKVLLVGDASARPAGLERALTRAGFQLMEQEGKAGEPQVDAVLISLPATNGSSLADLLPAAQGENTSLPPRIVLFSTSDPDGPARALRQGAADALAAPIHLPELCARLQARIRERPPRGAAPDQLGLVPPSSEVEDALDRRVREEFERARRYSLSFSLVLLGVDDLASSGQQSDAEAANRRREQVGGVLRRELRLPDFVVPYGGAEFAIVLPETDEAGARQSVARIRDRLSVVPFEGDRRDERPRFSAGIVTYPHPAATETDDLYALAEAALMRGKAQSGERIGTAV